MYYALLAPALLIFACSSAVGNGVAGNASDLRDFLMAGHRAAKIQQVAAERGCGPTDCSVDIDGLSIKRQRGVIQRIYGSQVRLIQYGPGAPKDLPEMDWDPIAGFKVFRTGKRWGTCLEFSHEGIGKSGRYQRWTSVVLVPWKESRLPTVAHRFVGYWAGCDALAEGARAGEVMLPIIETAAAGSSRLHIVWHHCTMKRCIKVEDARLVSGEPGSESGVFLEIRGE